MLIFFHILNLSSNVKYMHSILFALICLVGLLILLNLLETSASSSSVGSVESFSNGDSRLYLAGPSKCFSCERQMINTLGPQYAWMGRQSKCFSCENQLAAIDPDLANYTHGTKCFSCEMELADEPLPR